MKCNQFQKDYRHTAAYKLDLMIRSIQAIYTGRTLLHNGTHIKTPPSSYQPENGARENAGVNSENANLSEYDGHFRAILT